LYVRHKVRLEHVPRLPDAGQKAFTKQEKYRISVDLMPAEMRQRAAPIEDMAGERTLRVRVDYLVAMGRLSEARAIAEQFLAAPDSSPPASGGRDWRRRGWERVLAGIAEAEGRAGEALVLYRSSLTGIPREALARAEGPVLPQIKQFYRTASGTVARWSRDSQHASPRSVDRRTRADGDADADAPAGGLRPRAVPGRLVG
jgi:hypothetical protein